MKTINESIYYNVDMIHEAINKECQIEFQYFQWNIHKEMELRKTENVSNQSLGINVG